MVPKPEQEKREKNKTKKDVESPNPLERLPIFF
jgi:hypothetical protein